jgi:hypothetical protein
MKRSPRPTSRGEKGQPHTVLAERALWSCALHTEMWRSDPDSRWRQSALWDAEQAVQFIGLADGPRSVRTRARRLEQRLFRLQVAQAKLYKV